MTSLAQQLQRLAVPQIQATFGEDKKKASLLFDPKEAASIDRETFHSLGLNGLEELETLDENFHEFESSLFGDSSLTFERTVQTKEVNANLDQTIKRFLIRLSPYCLLKPAHKALEWLIHRFHIHFCNMDELIMCFLPYHESKVFARILQLIKFDSKLASKWDWLRPLQKAGVHLSRQTLTNHCLTNPAFLSFVCDMVPCAIKVLTEKGETVPKCRVLFSFYATTVIGVLDGGKITEVILATLLPHLARGLKSQVLEYKAATYMILSQLLHSATLKTEMLEKLQKILTKGLVGDLLEEGMACLLLMFQTQDMTQINLTKKSFKHICKHYTVVDVVSRLSEQFEAQTFLSSFLKRLVPAAFKHAVGIATSGESSESDSSSSRGLQEYLSMLNRLLSAITLPDDLAELVAEHFLTVYIKHGHKHLDEDVDGRLKDSLQSVVRQLEGKHSTAVDKAVRKVLKQYKKDGVEYGMVKEFLNLYVLSVPRQLVMDSETSLVLSLNHRLTAVREAAVNTLLGNRQALEDEDFLKNSLTARLQDGESKVVSASLQIGKEVWTVLEDDQKTINLLQSIVLRGLDKEKWQEPALEAIKLLGLYTGEKALDIVTSCLPCFCIRKPSKFQMQIVDSLLSSKLATQNELLKAVAKEWKMQKLTVQKNMERLGVVNSSLAHCLAVGLQGYLSQGDLSLVNNWCSVASGSQNIQVAYLMLVLMDDLISMATKEKVKLELCLLQVKLVRNLLDGKRVDQQSHVSMSKLDVGWSEVRGFHGNKSLVPVMFCLRALYSVINSVTVPSTLSADDVQFWQLVNDMETGDQYLILCVQLYSLLLTWSLSYKTNEVVSLYRYLLKQFEQKCFNQPGSFLKFLGLIWSCHVNEKADDLDLSVTLQTQSLTLYFADIQQQEPKMLESYLRDTTLITNLLILTTSQHVHIRTLAIQVAEYLYTNGKETESVLTPLLKKIVRCKGEIESDPTYVQQVIASVFRATILSPTEAGSQSAKKTKGRRKSGADVQSRSDTKRECLIGLIDVVVGQKTPYYVQKCLLEVMSQLNNKEVLESFLPLLSRLVQLDLGSAPPVASHCLTLLLHRFTIETGACLGAAHSGNQLFLKALKLHQAGDQSPQLTAIQQVTKDLYADLESESQHQILATLFDVLVTTETLEIANQIRKVIKHLPVNAMHITEELKKCLKTPAAKTVREAKRQKRIVSESEEKAEFDSREWQRVTVILESVQHKKKLQNYTVLVPVCFQILSSILESDSHVSAEYIKQLILTLLHNVCCRMENEEDEDDIVPEKQFNMELIVNCIRSSDNPQTHHQALILLTAAAKIYPEHLLHNMMSVFTFMGANIMRQDDAYSFLIISKILETVIPSLIAACEQRKHVPKGITNDLEDIITMVIQVFVDSYPYIPEHRRHLLFNKLLQVIGEQQYLWRTLLMMMDLAVTKGTLKSVLASESQESASNVPSADVEFCLSMSAAFSPRIQLHSVCEMIKYLSKLPDEKEEENTTLTRPVPQSFGKLRKDDAQLFNVAQHTGKQLRHFKYAVIHLLILQFSSTKFISQVAEAGSEDLLSDFQITMETILQYVSQVTMVTNKLTDKPTAKFWRALQHKVHDLLDKLVSLLPEVSFLEAIGGLVSHDLPTIQRKAMDLLNAKLQQQKDTTEKEVAALLPLAEKLLELVKGHALSRNTSEDELVNSQAAFISLKLLCRRVGHQHPQVFIEVLKTAVDVFKKRHGNQQVASCALLCIAEVCSTLKVHVIQYLPTFMPTLIRVMKKTEDLLQNELYLMSVVTTVNKVVENLAHFLSPYLLDILKTVCALSSLEEEEDALKKPQVQLRLKTIRSTLSTSLPTRVLLPVVTTCYTDLTQDDMGSVSSLIVLFGDHISHIGREDLTSHLVQLQAFFLQCLDLRIDHPEIPEKELSSLEAVTIETIITMVLKLSEATFKPFLFKVFDWATTVDEYKDRILVFYKFAERLAERLRSLFTLFAGHIMNHAANMLEVNNQDKQEEKFFPSDVSKDRKSCQLLDSVLDCIYWCCLYDTEGFITRERFQLLHQPLVDQLDNKAGGDEGYTDRVNGHLVRCIVQLAVAAQDDSLWKTLNYQVCLKTRSQEPEVKLATLAVLDGLHSKLGEDYMPLLPETVPFLAELMEDESEEVEQKCQEVIQHMEKTLGEPLQKYF